MITCGTVLHRHVTRPKHTCLSLDSQVVLSRVSALRQQKSQAPNRTIFPWAAGEKRALGSSHVVGLAGWTLKQRLSRSICLLAVREERVSISLLYLSAGIGMQQ